MIINKIYQNIIIHINYNCNNYMKTDSTEYDILTDAVTKIKNIAGLTCEIGVREGGSTELILNTLKNTKQNKIHIAIDPFGNIDYEHFEKKKN
tara:strand:+ start:350 stop:628 length:279 start_codon:yes stop_codon:yes gene_type:complete